MTELRGRPGFAGDEGKSSYGNSRLKELLGGDYGTDSVGMEMGRKGAEGTFIRSTLDVQVWASSQSYTSDALYCTIRPTTMLRAGRTFGYWRIPAFRTT